MGNRVQFCSNVTWDQQTELDRHQLYAGSQEEGQIYLSRANSPLRWIGYHVLEHHPR
jgi:hypothetical protein